MASVSSRAHLVPVGAKFGRWSVTGAPFYDETAPPRKRLWFVPCRCDCGVERNRPVVSLLNGSTQSCGCAQRENLLASHTKHGQTSGNRCTRLYGVWNAMIGRCHTPTANNFHDYGGRGITVCLEWRTSFEVFRDWAEANGYRSGLQIDRVDNDRGYEPDNCRWATSAVQNRNRRNSHWLTAFGETKCITDWASDPRCAVAQSNLRRRLFKLGWSPEEAISRPARAGGRPRRKEG